MQIAFIMQHSYTYNIICSLHAARDLRDDDDDIHCTARTMLLDRPPTHSFIFIRII